MPIYEYIAVEGGCANCREGFEFFQRPGEESLTHCLTCKTELERVMTSASVGSDPSLLKTKNTESKGFTTYKKVGKGEYEKVGGSDAAPDHLVDES